MKNALLLILVTMAVVACRKEINQEEVVANAAKQYYTYLLQGNYDAFVDGCWQDDSVRPSYRAELIDNAKMFISQQKTEHKGIRSVEVVSAQVDTATHSAHVFLNLHYGDENSEKILLPMVMKGDLWYMK